MNNTITSINNQQNFDHKENNYYNNNYNINTEPGVFILSAEDGERICTAYTENIGPMTAAVANMILSFLQKSLTVDNIVLAIEETGFAPRPSAYYLRAILRNWAQFGVTASKARHAAANEQRSNNPALWYQQRKYTDADFSGDDFITDAKKILTSHSHP